MDGRVVFVDDETAVLNALKRLFLDVPYKVATFDSSMDALQEIKDIGADVVVSDQKMPGMPGTEFLKEVRQIRPDAVRILMSGHADFEAAVSAINQGHVYHFIQKPWDDAGLKGIVEKALAVRQRIAGQRQLFDLIRLRNTELWELNRTVEEKVAARTAAMRRNEKNLKATMDRLSQATEEMSREMENCTRLLKRFGLG